MIFELNFILLLCLLLILITFFFKLGLVPFHQWLPDVYEGASNQITAYLSIVTKIPIVVIFICVLSGPFYPYIDLLKFPLLIVGCFSMLLGTYAALFQRNLKRLLAYSSLNHFGLVICTAACLSTINTKFIFLYIIIYTVNMIGIFAILLNIIYLKYKSTNEYLKDKNKKENLSITELHYKLNKNPYLAISLGVLFLSSAGIPPFGSFFTKYFVIQALITQGLYLPCACIILTSLISAFYYIRLISYSFFLNSFIFYNLKFYVISKSQKNQIKKRITNYESLLTYNISRINSLVTVFMIILNIYIPYTIIYESIWRQTIF